MDADAIDTCIDVKDEWIRFCEDLVSTEGVVDMHAGQKTGGVQKWLYQVDSDQRDVCGIPSPKSMRGNVGK